MTRIAAAAGTLLSLLAAGVVVAQSPPCPVRSLTVDPSNASILYATNSGGLFGSGDGGSTWRLLHAGVSQFRGWSGKIVEPLTIDRRDSRHLLLSTGKTLIESHDGGQSWTELAVPSAPYGLILTALFGAAFDPFDRGTLYVASTNWPGTGILTFCFLYRSVDGGQSWSPLLLGEPGMTAPILARSSAGRLLVGVFGGAGGPADPSGASHPGGILMSSDGGLTWSTNPATSSSGPWCADIVADPVDSNRLYAKVGCDTYATTDAGSNWVVVPPQNDCRVASLVSGPSEVFGNGPGGVLISRDGSLVWQPFLPPGNTLLAVDPSNGDVLYVERGGALLKSVDGGRTFSLLCEDPGRPGVRRSGPRGAAGPVAPRE